MDGGKAAPGAERRTWTALVAAARRRLAGPEHPSFEADELLARATGRPRAWFLARMRDAAPEDEAASFEALVERRAHGEPLQYLLGEWEFLGRTFHVDPRALIPRRETEAIVEIARGVAPGASSVLDLGTGSGILAVTLALERAEARVVAIDRSVGALALARRNARRHHVESRIRTAASDWLSAVSPRARFELAVSNPPYVPRRDAPHLDKTVSAHEPEVALYGGEDGLEAIRHLLRELPPFLAPGAPFIFELGYGQAKDVSALVEASEFRLADVHLDAAGIPRTATAVRR